MADNDQVVDDFVEKTQRDYDELNQEYRALIRAEENSIMRDELIHRHCAEKLKFEELIKLINDIKKTNYKLQETLIFEFKLESFHAPDKPALLDEYISQIALGFKVDVLGLKVDEGYLWEKVAGIIPASILPGRSKYHDVFYVIANTPEKAGKMMDDLARDFKNLGMDYTQDPEKLRKYFTLEYTSVH